MDPQNAEAVGRTDSLAGDVDEGIRYLSAASASCAILNGLDAVYSTWASFHLGQALETRGETANACTAYGRVLSRWGNARPASRTAAKARDRWAALRCPK